MIFRLNILALFACFSLACGEGKTVKFTSLSVDDETGFEQLSRVTEDEDIVVVEEADEDVAEVTVGDDKDGASAYERQLESYVEKLAEDKIGRKGDYIRVNRKVGRNKRETASNRVNIHVSIGGKKKSKNPRVLEDIIEEENSKVDMLFYVGWNSLGMTKPGSLTLTSYFKSRFKTCLRGFAKQAFEANFLDRLQDLDWQFSHSSFSSKTNKPHLLEHEGHFVKAMTKEGKVKQVAVLEKGVYKAREIFSHTLAPLFGDNTYHFSKYGWNVTLPRDDVYYDAPSVSRLNHDGAVDPLPGLDDLLTNKYGAVREGSRVEVFVLTDHFAGYSDEVVQDFLKKHPNVTIHLLHHEGDKSVEGEYELGALPQLVEGTQGTVHSLCGDEDLIDKLVSLLVQ